MRFWPFGRRREEAPPPVDRNAGRPEPSVAEGASSDSAAPSVVPPASAPWRDLPPLRPVAAEFPVAAPVQRLKEHLTPVHETRIARDHLTHARGPTGPTGSVAGLVTARGQRRVHATDPLQLAAAPEPVPVEEAVPLRTWSPPQPARRVQRLTGGDNGGPPAPTTGHRLTASPSATPAQPAGSHVLAAEPGGVEVPADPPALPTIAPRPVSARAAPPVASPTSTTSPTASTASTASPPSDPALDRDAPSPSAVVRSGRDQPRAGSAPTGDVAEPLRMPVAQRLPADPPSAAPELPARPETAGGPTARGFTPPSAPDRPDAPTLGSTRIVRRVGAPMASRPPTMVGPEEIGPPRQEVALPVLAPRPEPPPEPAPGALPMSEARPLPVGHRAPAGVSRLAAAPATATPTVASSTPDRPLVGGRRPIQRLEAAPPRMTFAASGGSATPEPAPVPVRRGVQRAPESVPPSVRSELEPVLGEPLDDVKVHRGPEVGEAARAIGAKAFATGGEVFLPDEHGPTSSGEGGRILKHELTHVVQQRALGGALPPEDSAAGSALEAQARRIGGQDPSGPADVPIVPVRARATSAPAQRLVGDRPPDPVRPLPAAPDSRPMSPSRASSPLPVAAQSAIVANVRAAAERAGVPTHVAPTGLDPHVPSISPEPVAGDPPVRPQRLAERTPIAAPTRSVESTSSPPPGPVAAEAAPDLDDLARRLYPRFRSRLRHDLLADRERAGRLFDAR